MNLTGQITVNQHILYESIIAVKNKIQATGMLYAINGTSIKIDSLRAFFFGGNQYW